MNVPVLLLLFNRPDFTNQLIEKLRIIKPSKIYINIDGPRKENLNEKILCKKVFDETKKIDWKTEKHINVSDYNKGCRKSVREAIDWVFSKEKQAIILEDDCIPSSAFFDFCTELLIKYNNNNKIKVISGSNFQIKKIGEADYYFSKYAHCWGWATWERAWNNYDNNMGFWENFKTSQTWKDLHEYKLENKYWIKKFDLVKNYKIDSWAYVWLASVWFNKGLTITPNKNLVKNIGFGSTATNTIGFENEIYSREISDEKIGMIKHPENIENNKQADVYVFENHFNGKYNFWPWRLFYLIKILINNPSTFFKKIKKKVRLL